MPTSDQVRTASSSGAASSFGAWRTPNSSRPTLVQIEFVVDPSGVSAAEVALQVDEDGGTTSDYAIPFNAPAGTGTITYSESFYIPAGGSYRIQNVSDPDNGNNAALQREWTL